MLHAVKILSIMLLLVTTSVASGQMADPAPEDSITFKEYSGQSVPDGVAFHMTLLLLNHDHENNRTEAAVAWIAEELDLNEAESRAFLTQALDTFQNIQADIKAARVSHLCEAGVPRVYNRDVYAALQQMYDIRNDIAEQHFQDTKSSLGEETGALLQEWMYEAKNGMGQVQIDFEKADKIRGRDTTARLSSMCEGTNK